MAGKKLYFHQIIQKQEKLHRLLSKFEKWRLTSTGNPFGYFFSFGSVSINAENALKIPLISEGKTKVFVFWEAVSWPIASTCRFAISKSIAGFPLSFMAFANKAVCFASAAAFTSI